MAGENHKDGHEIIRLGEFLPYRLSILSNRVSRAIAAHYERQFDLTMPEWRVMAIVAESPDISAGEVAERTAMDKVAVSRAVNRLIAAGRLERHFAADDRRRSVLALSKAGKRVYAQVVPRARAYEAALLDKLSTDERRKLDEMLDKLMRIQLDAEQGARA